MGIGERFLEGRWHLMCVKRWVRVGNSQSGEGPSTEETVWAEDKGEIQQLAYMCTCTGMCVCTCRVKAKRWHWKDRKSHVARLCTKRHFGCISKCILD